VQHVVYSEEMKHFSFYFNVFIEEISNFLLGKKNCFGQNRIIRCTAAVLK